MAKPVTAATPTLSIYDKLDSIKAEMNDYYLERSTVIDAMLTAIIAGQHVLLFGPPGTGKSDLVRALTQHIVGAQKFELLLTKFTAPEEVFGPYDVPEMMKGRYVRKLDNHLATSHLGFLDEIFKSSSAILNTLLTQLNERKYHQEGSAIDCPLITLVGASNELPESSDLHALDDRFVLRFNVAYLSPGSRSKLHRRQAGGYLADQTLELSEVYQLQSLVADVRYSDTVNDQFDKLLQLCEDEGLKLSDRAMLQAKKILSAHAVLEGRDFVVEDDFEILENVLWKNPKDRLKVRQLVGKVSNPVKAQANELVDAAMAVYVNMKPVFAAAATPQTSQQAFEANSKFKGAMTELTRLRDNNPGVSTTAINKALATVESLNDNVTLWIQGKPLRAI